MRVIKCDRCGLEEDPSKFNYVYSVNVISIDEYDLCNKCTCYLKNLVKAAINGK